MNRLANSLGCLAAGILGIAASVPSHAVDIALLITRIPAGIRVEWTTRSLVPQGSIFPEYYLESSSDLVNWQGILTNRSVSTVRRIFQIVEAPAPEPAFFRVRTHLDRSGQKLPRAF